MGLLLVVGQWPDIWCDAAASERHFVRSDAALRNRIAPAVAVSMGRALSFADLHG